MTFFLTNLVISHNPLPVGDFLFTTNLIISHNPLPVGEFVILVCIHDNVFQLDRISFC